MIEKVPPFRGSVWWSEPFSFPSEQRQEIANLIGKESIVRVERICQDYLGFSKEFQNKLPRGEINKKIREVHKCTSKIVTILEDLSVAEELDLLVQEQYPSLDFIQRNNTMLQTLKEDMQPLETATRNYAQNKRGRPKGSGDEAAALLAYQLYYCCKAAGHIPTIIEGSAGPGLLHEILDILRGPLNIGAGEMTGIFSMVIKKNQREK